MTSWFGGTYICSYLRTFDVFFFFTIKTLLFVSFVCEECLFCFVFFSDSFFLICLFSQVLKVSVVCRDFRRKLMCCFEVLSLDSYGWRHYHTKQKLKIHIKKMIFFFSNKNIGKDVRVLDMRHSQLTKGFCLFIYCFRSSFFQKELLLI